MASKNSSSLRQPSPLDLFQDCGVLRRPAKGDGPEILMGGVNVNHGDAFTDAGETALSNNMVGELAKKRSTRLSQGEPVGVK